MVAIMPETITALIRIMVRPIANCFHMLATDFFRSYFQSPETKN